MTLPNCWDIKKCGRQKNGEKVFELDECIASKEDLGHSCWTIAGTLCKGVVQRNAKEKEKSCKECKVYKRYNRISGEHAQRIKDEFLKEQSKYSQIIFNRVGKLVPVKFKQSE